MSISVNGHSTVPPGFRFHPTEEELLSYYLRKKVASEHIDLNVIRDIDLNKLEPWDIQEKCRVGTTPQNDWYFFSHKDKKYPTGTRTNRATAAGFWKATGRDKVIYASLRRIGMRKTLVFYMGRAPHGQKSDWIMHEYRLDELCDSDCLESNGSSLIAENQLTQEEGWVICRVFKKKNHHKQPPQTSHSSSENSLDQILHYNTAISSAQNYARNLRPIDTLLSRATTLIHERFAKLPALAGPAHPVQETDGETGFGDWTVLDRFVSYELDAYPFCPPATLLLGEDGGGGGGGEEDDGDLWSLAKLATCPATSNGRAKLE